MDSEDSSRHDEDESSSEDCKPLLVHVDRPALNQDEFHQLYGLHDGKLSGSKVYQEGWMSIRRSARRCLRHLKSVTCHQLLLTLIPIIQWLPKYQWKRDLASDCAAGFTVAVMQVPQGLAYAILANVPPIIGIYTAFFPVIIYTCLGTSRHVSMGTFAVVSILTSKPIVERCSDQASEDAEECAIKVMSTVTFLSGFIMLGLGCLRLGALSAFLTDPIVSGFTTGAGVHVFTSQIKYLFGIKIARYIGPGKLIKTYIDLFKNINDVNPVALILSAICIVILLGFDLFIKPKTDKYCKFPIPIQFVVVICATCVSYFTDLKTLSKIKVIGNVPTGLPSPELPDFGLMPSLLGDAFTITIIGYVVTLSIGRIVAAKFKYYVDPNQELVAMGTANIFGCFFQSLPMTGSMSRTLVQVSSGGKTLMASLLSVFLLLWVLLFAGPLFQDLPNAVLASIIVVSLRGILVQFKDLISYGKRSYSEVFVWMATFVGTVCIDIDYGLMIGLGTSLAFLLWWGYHPRIELLGCTEKEDLFLDQNNDLSIATPGLAIIRITGNLNLANAPLIEDQLTDLLYKEFGETETDQPTTILLDLSCVPHIDPSACQCLESIHSNFKKRLQNLYYIGLRGGVWRRMSDMKAFKTIPKNQCYPTLQDCLASLKYNSP